MPWAMEVKKLCQQGRLEESLKILDVMTQQGMQVPIATYTCVLKECARIKALEHGKHVHTHIHTCGVVPNIMLENTLVDMYGKCGSIYDAHRTFNHMSKHNVFSWTAIITAYVKEGKNHEAVELFQKMQNEGVIPDKFVVVIVLKACGTMEALQQGRQVHTDIIRCSIVLDLFLCSTLVDMYAKCKCIPDARQVFDNMTERDVVSWNAMISGYAQQGPQKEAIVLFEAMQQGGVKPSDVTFAFVIKACAVSADVERGKRFHKNIIRCGLSRNVFVANSLLDMYSKCGCLENAQQVFDDMHDRDVVSWTIIMACHVQQGLGRRALTLFKEMQQYNVIPNGDTFVSALNACAREESFEEGRQLHAQIIEIGLVLDTFIGSSLVDMYAKCGSIDDASHVFTMIPNQDVVSWNAIIAGCTQQGLYVKALSLFVKMHQAGIQPGGITFASIIKASAGSVAPEQGKRLHAYVVEKALEYDVFVGSTLVDMYAKYGSIKDAYQVFSKLQEHDIVVWNTMMTGYVQHGLEEEAVMLFESMTCEGAEPNEATFTIILKACASLTVLEWGKVLHCQIFEKGYESYLVKSALLDMYAKCGSIEDARSLFNKMHARDVVAWTAMITGYTLQGCGKEAVALFEEMQREVVKPNEVTFIGILCGCSHTGLMDEGRWLFASMIRHYGMTPMTDHFACIVDLLSRAGLLEEAYAFLKAMPISAGEVLWMSLLGACRISGSVELAQQVTEEVLKVNPQNSSAFVQLSNIYAVGETLDPG